MPQKVRTPHMRKWTKTFILLVTVVMVMTLSCVTAFAAEADVIDETFTGVEIPTEDVNGADDTVVILDETTGEAATEPIPDGEMVTDPTTETDTEMGSETGTEPNPENTDKADDAFSVDGNGEVLDNVMDEKSGKEFYTITTANNNTYYLIIDHSSNTKNVYMLSMIDENDLKEFLSEEIPETPDDTGTPPSVDLGDEPSGENPDTDTDEKKSGGNIGTYIILAALAVIVGGAAFYFKVYKPKKEARLNDDEDMEGYIDEGEAVNEDDNSDGEINADTPIDELAFNDEEE